jgi:hypothetical protein
LKPVAEALRPVSGWNQPFFSTCSDSELEPAVLFHLHECVIVGVW